MKKIILFLVLGLLAFACSDNSPSEPDDGNDNAKTFTSHNVKTEGTQYFKFETNSGYTENDGNWDIAFSTVPLTVETQPCQFFTMPYDPVILAGEGVTIAKVNAESLDDVTSVPSDTAFHSDNPEGNPFIGKNWFDENYNVRNDVYVIKTCPGNFALLQITGYDMDFTNFQVSNIIWKFKYNADGSTDFTNTAVDTFETGNAYTETRYFSFANGSVTADDSYDLKIVGSTIWLGNNVKAKRLENTELETVTTVSDDNFESDVQPYYVTRDWYSYGENHIVTPDDFVFVVKTSDGKYPAFEITNYYDSQGNSGSFTIKWKYLQ